MRIPARAALTLAALAIAGCSERGPQIPPQQITEANFHYPEDLWDARVEGETLLEIHVSSSGSVDSAKVHETSGHAEFDSAAVEGARELLFVPGRQGDEDVPVRVLLPVQFQLPGADSVATTPRGETADTSVLEGP